MPALTDKQWEYARYLIPDKAAQEAFRKALDAAWEITQTANSEADERRAKKEKLQRRRDVECWRCLMDAFAGGSVLATSADENVTAADLNAAAAGTFKRKFLVRMNIANGDRQILFSGAVDLTPAEAVADADVGAPTTAAQAACSGGATLAEVTFDTDAGATKTYAPGDSVTVQISMPAGSAWPGASGVSSVTKTYNVV